MEKPKASSLALVGFSPAEVGTLANRGITETRHIIELGEDGLVKAGVHDFMLVRCLWFLDTGSPARPGAQPGAQPSAPAPKVDTREHLARCTKCEWTAARKRGKRMYLPCDACGAAVVDERTRIRRVSRK